MFQLSSSSSNDPAQEWLAGVDEVGRGALFGPVVAGAVILPEPVPAMLITAGVTDSKRLTPAARARLVPLIQEMAIAHAIGIASVAEIDRLNILQATFLAMRRAIARLDPEPHQCLVDGNRPIPHLAIAQQTLIKGDQLSLSIASASILAKVWRDTLIIRLAKRYPGYFLESNKGYGTAAHCRAIAQLGTTRQHRRSFKLGHSDLNASAAISRTVHSTEPQTIELLGDNPEDVCPDCASWD